MWSHGRDHSRWLNFFSTFFLRFSLKSEGEVRLARNVLFASRQASTFSHRSPALPRSDLQCNSREASEAWPDFLLLHCNPAKSQAVVSRVIMLSLIHDSIQNTALRSTATPADSNSPSAPPPHPKNTTHTHTHKDIHTGSPGVSCSW